MPSTPADEPSGFEHPPLPAERIPPSQYDQSFLDSLRANGQLRSVDANWDRRSADFPPNVTHVLHPNGDLERIGMS